MDPQLDALVQRAIVKVCGIEAERVRRDARLADLGIDSLAAAEVLVEVEIQLGKQLPIHVLRRLDQAGTVGDVAAQLELALADGSSVG
jgi:acyl carrier protein